MSMIKFNKPWYELYYRMYCSGIIYVNEVPVVKHFGERTNSGGLSGQMPINNVFFESGKYKVKGVMLPRKNKKALDIDNYMSIDFNVSDLNRWKETKQSFHPELESPDSELVPNDDINAEFSNKLVNPIENLPVYEMITEIAVEVPYKITGWKDSLDLSKFKKEELFKDVFNYYQMLYSTLKRHDATKYIELSKEKMELQKVTFYMNNAKVNEIYNDIAGLFQEKLAPLPLKENELRLEIFGNNKLISLSRLDGTSALQFKSPDLRVEDNISLDVKLHLVNKNKGFSII